jgi:hypothetical protein
VVVEQARLEKDKQQGGGGEGGEKVGGRGVGLGALTGAGGAVEERETSSKRDTVSPGDIDDPAWYPSRVTRSRLVQGGGGGL